MKNSFTYLFIILVFASCYETENKSSSHSINEGLVLESSTKEKDIDNLKSKERRVDQIHIGMTITKMKEIYANAEFLEEPVYEYGVDGESMGIVIKKENERLFFVWTLEGDDKIKGITVLSDKIEFDDSVHVGMTLEKFMAEYPDSNVNIDMVDNRCEFIYIPKHQYRVEFLTTDSTRVARYDFNEGEPEFLEIIRPNAIIDRISIN